MTSSINFNMRPFGEDTLKDKESDLEKKQKQEQMLREKLFFGDSIEKKKIEYARTEYKNNRKARTLLNKEKKRIEKMEELRMDNMLKRGEGSDEKPIRSEAHGKENEVLKPWLRTYQNVDENINAIQNKLCPYQLVHEGNQFRFEHPDVSYRSNSSNLKLKLVSLIDESSPFLNQLCECHIENQCSLAYCANVPSKVRLSQDWTHRQGHSRYPLKESENGDEKNLSHPLDQPDIERHVPLAGRWGAPKAQER